MASDMEGLSSDEDIIKQAYAYKTKYQYYVVVRIFEDELLRLYCQNHHVLTACVH